MSKLKFVAGDAKKVATAIATAITKELRANKRVLWLVSGGSNIAIEVAVMQKLHKNAKEHLASLAVLPMDERYGDAGHPDSNTQSLRAAGFVPGEAIWLDILGQNVSFEDTVAYYGKAVETALEHAHVVIGQFGIGADGHIAGILPNSPACEVDDAYVAGYQWADYVRITLAPRALRAITTGFAVAFGEQKQPALARLQAHTESVADLPSVLLYDLPKITVFTDNETNKE